MKNVFFFFAISCLFIACIKDPLATTTNNNNNSTPPTPSSCPGADGALWAVKSITKQQTTTGFPAISITLTSAVKGGKTICFGKEMVQQLSVTVQ